MVVWTRIDFTRLRDPGRPRAQTRDGKHVLLLPFRTRVSYYLSFSAGASLLIDALTSWREGAEGAVLEVTVEPPGSSPRVFRLPLLSTHPITVPLGFDRATIARLTLRAQSPGPLPDHRAGLRLVRPVVESRRVEVSPSTAGRKSVRRSLPDGRRPNVLIYLIDTLRADRLGCYGYARATSPHIDAFAKKATLFDSFFAQSSWTKPTVASLFTGLYPQVHGAIGGEMLPDAAETLHGLGYQTAGIVTNYVVTEQYGFQQGFEHYQALPARLDTAEVHQQSDQLNQAAFEWLHTRDTSKPFFLYLHSIDPHAPYTPREPFRSRLAREVDDPSVGSHATLMALKEGRQAPAEGLRSDLSALYDAEIVFNDHNFGALIDELKRSGLYASSLVVLVSDHGEEFLDHGRWEHGLSLFEEQLHVPLIMKFPDGVGAGRRIHQRVQQVDVMPTVLDVVGAEVPERVQGASLLPFMSATAQGPVRPYTYAYLYSTARKIESFVFEHTKLIRYGAYDQPRPAVELFDLDADPGESTSRVRELSVKAGYLRTFLERSKQSWPRGLEVQEHKIDPEALARLKALGYAN